jgi:RNA polymerase sigma-70 factor (ECF subfamily)
LILRAAVCFDPASAGKPDGAATSEPDPNSVVTSDVIKIDPHVEGQSSDRALVARLKRLDSSAFEEAFQRLRAPLYSFLVRLSGDRTLAEDLLQETWVRLATSATQLADDTELRAWLFTVARNLHTSHRRWVLLDEERLRSLGFWPRRAPHTPFEQASANEAERKAEAAIASLPLKYREVLLLVAVERLEPIEAAAVLGIKPEALRQRLVRARGMIAARMALESRAR